MSAATGRATETVKCVWCARAIAERPHQNREAVRACGPSCASALFRQEHPHLLVRLALELP